MDSLGGRALPGSLPNEPMDSERGESRRNIQPMEREQGLQGRFLLTSGVAPQPANGMSPWDFYRRTLN
ncbi:hypothetical protein CgunFtcFv8_017097 [Champsocephalus gunnari]|uniref:Uncharacterized protein n=1 Tax=Champsocephalus gunnari TaxID=52237 RepID=A0AAN8CS47_CHAGU|nr:hypothetical protein CgunFtcFv8_017097 [Champsocephalus gunnari]